MFTKSNLLLLICLGVIAGNFTGKFLTIKIISFLVIIAIILLTIAWQKSWVKIFGVIVLITLSSSNWFQYKMSESDLSEFYGKKMLIQGIISDEPDVRSDKVYLTINSLEVNERKVRGKIQISLAKYPEYDYGDKLTFEVKIQEPFETEEFSYKNYLKILASKPWDTSQK
ncbi:MAG TPA: DUF4131 domain-containing protein [Verrucomicrobiae bacterium]|nr:DUF4131 domain-containing protein [Verrucomicrobiae bacterium]